MHKFIDDMASESPWPELGPIPKLVTDTVTSGLKDGKVREFQRSMCKSSLSKRAINSYKAFS